MRPDEHLSHERSMAKHHALDTAGGRAWLAEHDAELTRQVTDQVRAQLAAETTGERVPAGYLPDGAITRPNSWIIDAYLSGSQDNQEWALIDNADPDDLRKNLERAIELLAVSRATPATTFTPSDLPPAEAAEHRYVVTPHLPTLSLVAHRMDEFADHVDAEGERPYEEMSPAEALAAVVGGIRSEVEAESGEWEVVVMQDAPAEPFTYTHRWRNEGLSYEHLGQVRQSCLCGERRTMYAIAACNCARTGGGTLGENSGHCVVHPLPGCPNPACGESWIAVFHGDHCDSCGWTSPDGTQPDGTPVVDMTPRALAWAEVVFEIDRHPMRRLPLPFPEHWAERVVTYCNSRPARTPITSSSTQESPDA